MRVEQLVLEGLGDLRCRPVGLLRFGDAVPLEASVHAPPWRVPQVAGVPLVAVHGATIGGSGQFPGGLLEVGDGPVRFGIRDAGTVEVFLHIEHHHRADVRWREVALGTELGLEFVGVIVRPGRGPLVARGPVIKFLQGTGDGIGLPLPSLEVGQVCRVAGCHATLELVVIPRIAVAVHLVVVGNLHIWVGGGVIGGNGVVDILVLDVIPHLHPDGDLRDGGGTEWQGDIGRAAGGGEGGRGNSGSEGRLPEEASPCGSVALE